MTIEEAGKNSAPLVVRTIGHSTRPVEEFMHLLCSHGIERLVDVRTVPRSRHNPQFNRETLSQSLHAAGIHYSYMPGLGGFRRARRSSATRASSNTNSATTSSVDKASVNPGWRNASFRGYADYMQTAEFERQLEALIALAQAEKIAVMCAEAVPWRCHRSLIADALTVRGIEVREITGAHSERVHALTSFARVHGTRIHYPAEAAEAPEDTAP